MVCARRRVRYVEIGSRDGERRYNGRGEAVRYGESREGQAGALRAGSRE
jgi:hypothetical protein